MVKEAFLVMCREKGYSREHLDLFMEALEFSQTVLGDKKRLSGDSFFEHNCRTAMILVENNAEPETIVAGLLNGVLKHKGSREILERFGSERVELLHGVEDISTVKSKNIQLEADALRKILLTTLKDVRVILVKLAAKIDNLKTIAALPSKDQKRIAEEVLEIYAPLAYRLGLEKMRVALENLAFRIVNPRKYEEISKFLEESQEQRQKNIEQAMSIIKEKAAGSIPILAVKGRPKHVYSIYRKMKSRGVRLNKQYDLLGIRLIVPEEKDCYNLLGLLHEIFEPIEDRLKDYISNPKHNFYRSIHTGVKLPSGSILEIQIRTPEMDELAEEGIAAHWKYKGVKSDTFFDKKLAWLKALLQMQKGDENKEFLETVKVDIFGDKLHCYTPKGDVKELPQNATLLDFAYAVHEHVGNQAIAGRVNGKFVSLKHKLKTGDIVEVLTNKNQRPRRGWIKIVQSAKARQRIRRSLREFEKLPAFHYRRLKPLVKDEQNLLVNSEEFPNAMCILAKCCRALPGDDIVGLLTKRRVVSVHREDCRDALKEEERWTSVVWKETFNQKIKFFILASERSGLLADLLHTIANAGFEVKEAKAKLIDSAVAECSFQVVPRDLEQLQELVKRVGKVKGLRKIYFE
ncbi:hypothetical protein COV20_02025 [Candidatus Woesearchaeota archaeon CG10_big_fil_rev_8_21_14_0_10_45_16]|nr:MAG: hypothetical protein COV20_02025 [Candidatus Woesearchaeota archaeon CG10_big_fil_rev_8_21_14_0_10_45_16]